MPVVVEYFSNYTDVLGYLELATMVYKKFEQKIRSDIYINETMSSYKVVLYPVENERVK